ncbi:MAG: serine protein kinase PrkA [Planctomycetota bacterium]
MTQSLDTPAKKLLDELRQTSCERFETQRTILSFPEYLELVLEDPARHTRNAALYLRDLFDHFGTTTVQTPRGRQRRFKLFDAEFNGHKTRVLGQETLQNEVYKELTTFCERGRVDKLIMLHGPNGTAKSTFVECMTAGMEHYSSLPEGVLYTFNWVFSDRPEGASFGFLEKDPPAGGSSLAYLEPDQISFKLGPDLKDHPLLLIPAGDRLELLQKAFAAAKQPFRLPDVLREGDLSPKNRPIFDALVNARKGDLPRVYDHVQVERLYVSRRYRRCAVVIQPQRNVDAGSRPLNLEKSYRLPPMLSQSSLSELSGDLVDANRGLVEYSDFFKRPLELSKYLLTTSEKGTISLPDASAELDCVLFATSNEKNMTLFKRNPDFPSFKGRFELVRAPYLLRWSIEEQIYAREITSIANHKPIAPHTTRIAALWAVLTRLRRPQPDHYTGDIKPLVARLNPLEKAHLYNDGTAPEGWSDAERRELLRHLEELATEWDVVEEEFEGLPDTAYEGRRGASPREVKTLLQDAVLDEESPCLSPLAVLKAIRALAADRRLYEFLRLDPDGDYNDVDALTDYAESEYRRLVRNEVHQALALVTEGAYEQLFEDYFQHVRAFDANEKVLNPHTQRLEPASTQLMERVEARVGIGDTKPKEYRKGLILRIAAWVIDNPGKPVAYREIFSDIFGALRAHYHKEREAAISKFQTQLLRYGTDDWARVDEVDQQRVVDAFERLAAIGYEEVCAKEALVYVLRHQGKD